MKGKKKGGGGVNSGTDGGVEQPMPPPPGFEAVVAATAHTASDEAVAAAAVRDQQQPELHQNRPRRQGGGGVDTCQEEDEDDDEDDDEYEDEDHFGHLQIGDPEADAQPESERPKLAEGYYEIEAVRRKRVRKGEVQYLIKWRGWPETANTWEPVENLMSCTDVIEAFEDSCLKSGKLRACKRKRKSGGSSVPQGKKKQQRTPAASTNSVPAVDLVTTEETFLFPCQNDWSCANGTETNAGGMNNRAMAKPANDNIGMDSTQNEKRKEHNDLDIKLSELKGMSASSEGNLDNFALQFQEVRTPSGVSPVNGLAKVDGEAAAQAGRCTGARRRKSGSVKRFKRESVSCPTNDGQDTTTKTSNCRGTFAQQGVQNPNGFGSDYVCKDEFNNSIHICDITEIIKPISYSASETTYGKDVLVTFMAMRSDGKEVMVDNKYLKANNPLLLINFYEQHLRYTPNKE